MRNLILAAGVAALAISLPATAKPGGGHGGGQEKAQQGGGGQKAQREGGNQAQAQRGGGGGQKAKRGGDGGQRMQGQGGGKRQAQHIQRQGGGQRQAQRIEHRGGGQQRFANLQSDREHGKQRAETRGGGNRQTARIDHRGGGNRDASRVGNRANRDVARIDNRHGNQRFENRGGPAQRATFADRDLSNARRVNFDNNVRVAAFDDRHTVLRSRDDYRRYDQWRDWNDNDWDRHYAYRGLPAAYVGCPPGLAKKSPACVPPGLARSAFIGSALPNYYTSNYLPVGLRDIYYDTPNYYYRYGDGYVYRVNRADNLVAALLPLIGAGYGVGQYFPNYQQPAYYVPSYYQSFYPDTPYDYYRYDDGYVYRIDAGSGYVEDVIPLLDRGYGLGQMLPAGYSYYNVPYQYRDYYYDTPDYYYRYAPGAIYQVDRNTQLITAISSLLTGGLAVGQPLPPAYSVYNVPLSYRDRYYDTPNSWYRYSNGYIYQVDPATQLITAMITAALV